MWCAMHVCAYLYVYVWCGACVCGERMYVCAYLYVYGGGGVGVYTVCACAQRLASGEACVHTAERMGSPLPAVTGPPSLLG